MICALLYSATSGSSTVDLLLALRRLLQQMVAATGSLVALVTFASTWRARSRRSGTNPAA
jgi:hypothetical protein